MKLDDEGILELWIAWLREKYRQDYDDIMAQLVIK